MENKEPYTFNEINSGDNTENVNKSEMKENHNNEFSENIKTEQYPNIGEQRVPQQTQYPPQYQNPPIYTPPPVYQQNPVYPQNNLNTGNAHGAYQPQNFVCQPIYVQQPVYAPNQPVYVNQPQAQAPVYYVQQPIQKVVVLPPGYTPRTYEERKDLKKRTNVVGIAMMAMILLSSLWSEIVYLAGSFLGKTNEEVYEFLTTSGRTEFISLLLSIFLFTVPFIVITKIANFRISDLMSFSKSKKGTALPYFLIGIGFCTFANVVTNIAGNFFSRFGVDYSVPSSAPPAGIFGFLLSVISTAVVPALVEEFACRGILFGILKKYGDAFAIITTAVIFGLMHGNFIQIPFAFLVGLLLGLIRVKTGSMRICILVHFANNFISVAINYLEEIMPMAVLNSIYTVYVMLSMLLAVIGVLILSKNSGEFVFEKSQNECTAKQKYKWFATSPFIIIFAVMCIFESFSFFFI